VEDIERSINMFWQKKQTSSTAVKEPRAEKGVKLTDVKAEAKKPKTEKLPGPRPIPGPVGTHLMTEYKLSANLVQILKAVVHKRPQGEAAFDIRIFDQSEADAKEMQIRDYTTLNEHPDLVLYEGWFDEDTKHVEMTEKRKVSSDVPLFTEAEIQRKIEALSQPGSTVFFYQARGPAYGGPLGKGAAIVELNPNYPKKGKKYNIHTANVVGTEPVAHWQKLFDSNKSAEIAKWIKDAHQQRMY
jgi:hypothetical protein